MKKRINWYKVLYLSIGLLFVPGLMSVISSVDGWWFVGFMVGVGFDICFGAVATMMWAYKKSKETERSMSGRAINELNSIIVIRNEEIEDLNRKLKSMGQINMVQSSWTTDLEEMVDWEMTPEEIHKKFFDQSCADLMEGLVQKGYVKKVKQEGYTGPDKYILQIKVMK